MSGLFTGEYPIVTCIHGARPANEPCRRCQAREQLDYWAAERRQAAITRRWKLLERVVVGGFLWFASAYFAAHWLVALGVGR